MKPDLSGKKLLILGAGIVETTLVKRAQGYGIYVVVTDYNTDHRISPAKDIADEYWDISWSDIDALEAKCRKERIDGVISGYSEFRVENNIKLCERLGFPCYINMDQLNITRDKILFKDTCRKSGVPVIKEYTSVDDVDEFPVIVKPADRAGSIGVGIADNYSELVKAYTYAMEKSVCKKVIIEQYIQNKTKFDVYYAIINGEITLLSSDDVLMAKANGREKVVQSAWVLPSVYHDLYKDKADPLLRKMISNMGIKNGYIFFSGFADGTGDFRFFECGFRLCGGHLYHYFPKIGHVNNMDLLIFYALTGNAECVREDICAGTKMKNVTVNLYSKAGKLTTIEGFDKLQTIPECCFAMQHAYEGMVCTDDTAILSKIGMAYFCHESAEKLAGDVDLMYRMIHVENEYGEDMIYDRINPQDIAQWWG